MCQNLKVEFFHHYNIILKHYVWKVKNERTLHLEKTFIRQFLLQKYEFIQ